MRELYRPVLEPVAECDVVALAQDVTALLQPEATRRSVALRLRASEWPLYAPVQRDGVSQILNNLMRNALDASPAGGNVEVVVEADGDLRFTVTDEGPGVADELAEHIFEPFFTTKSGGDESTGLGLGLSIAQGLAGAMQGRLALLKGRAQGAAFQLVLPRQAQPTLP